MMMHINRDIRNVKSVAGPLFAFAFLSAIASAQDSPDKKSSAKTYTNPVYAHDFPDPHVIAHEGRFFAYATHTRGTGFQLMESPDLVTWTPHILEFPVPWAKDHYWAPEVFQRGDTFYMTYSALDPETKKHHIAVATASSPRGPFTHREILVRGDDNEVGVIDATIAEHNGRHYLIYSEETPRRIVMRPLRDDMLGTDGPPVEVIKPELEWENGVTEAPTLVKRDGLFHLFYSGSHFEGRKQGPSYAVGHAVAKRFDGPYVKDKQPLMQKIDGKVYGPGHQCVVQLPGDAWWMLYHAWDNQKEPRYGSNPLGRTLRIDRIEWNGDAPKVNGPTTTEQPGPKVENPVSAAIDFGPPSNFLCEMLRSKRMRDHINVTEEQIEPLRMLVPAVRQLNYAALGVIDPPAGSDMKPKTPEAYASVQDAWVRGIVKILRADQLHKMRQIDCQMRDLFACDDLGVATGLGLSADQRQTIAMATEAYSERLEAMKGQPLAQQMRQIPEIRADTLDAIRAVLNERQRALWREFCGPPLDLIAFIARPGEDIPPPQGASR